MPDNTTELKKYNIETNMDMLRARASFDIIKHIDYYSTNKTDADKYLNDLDKCITKDDIVKYIQKFDLTIDY